MTPQSSARRVHTPRTLVRRSATFLVAAVLVGGVPLVAQALTEEPATGPTLATPPSEVWDSPALISSESPNATPSIPDLGADLEAAPQPVDVVPAPDAAPVVEEATPAEPAPLPEVVPAGPPAEQWAALRDCESGGDYSITNPSGKYRGAYQFDRSTWNSVAERHAQALVGVDPAAASPAEQDAMALALYTERGARPWPHCGRHLN
jgi:hypothetical protein